MYLSHCLESSRCCQRWSCWDVGVTLAYDEFLAVLYRNHIWTRARTNITISTQHDFKHVSLQLSKAKVASFWGASFPKTCCKTHRVNQSRAAPSYLKKTSTNKDGIKELWFQNLEPGVEAEHAYHILFDHNLNNCSKLEKKSEFTKFNKNMVSPDINKPQIQDFFGAWIANTTWKQTSIPCIFS